MGDRYDVMVVGLGPAGAAAAVELARGGARVLALQRPEPRPKPCGGCLALRWEQDWSCLGLELDRLGSGVRHLELCLPGREPLRRRSRQPVARLVERNQLNQLLEEAALQAGVEVVRQAVDNLYQDERGFVVIAGEYNFWGDWLLGADGARSLVGRRMRLTPHVKGYLALSEDRPPAPGRERAPGTALLELGGRLGGYRWAFFREGEMNTGLMATRWPEKGAHLALRQSYAEFLRRHHLGPPGRFRTAMIPCPAGRLHLVAAGRTAVLGDAAALCDPFLGEGIGQAVHSGLLAARAVLAEDLGAYQRAVERELLPQHAHARRLARLIYGLPRVAHALARRRPGSLELGFSLLRGELSHRRLWGTVLRRMLGRGISGPVEG